MATMRRRRRPIACRMSASAAAEAADGPSIPEEAEDGPIRFD